MNIFRFSAWFQFTIVMTLGFFALAPIDQASAHHCKGNHANYPGCDSGGGGGGGEDPPANPAFVYTHDRSGPFLIDVDGTNKTSLLNRKESRGIDSIGVRWSPDGEYIGFYDPIANQYPDVDTFKFMAADGSNRWGVQPVDETGERIRLQQRFEWSNVDPGVEGSATRIFFLGHPGAESNSRGWDVFTVDPSAGSVVLAHNVTKSTDIDRIHEFTVSPGGRQIVVTYFEDEYFSIEPTLLKYELFVGISGELEIQHGEDVTPSLTPTGNFDPIQMAWANTSDKIVYSNEGSTLHVIDLSTTIVTQLTGPGPYPDVGYPRNPTWSPDDSQIAFSADCCNNSDEGLHTATFDIDVSGTPFLTDLTKITSNIKHIRPDWRPTWKAVP